MIPSALPHSVVEPNHVSFLSVVADFIYKVEHMPQTVGMAWLLSSAIYTTYATKFFLDYQSPPTITQFLETPTSAAATATTTSTTSPTAYGNRRRRWCLPTVPTQYWSGVSRPTLLTLFRFGGSLILGLVAHADVQVWKRLVETIQAAPDFLLPAICLFTANFSNAISLNRIGISLTYTSKCAIPLITVVLALLMDGPKVLPGGWALLSLVPIAVGIGAASWHAPTFEKAGFLAAMLSATAQSALNVSSKRAMLKTGIRGASAQRVMVALGFVIAAVVTWLENAKHFADTRNDGGQLLPQQQEQQSTASTGEPLGIYIMAVTAYHIEYVLSFMFVKLVSPVTFGACDAVRRLAIILSGRVMFGGKPLTLVNISGIGLALLGALGYSVASSTAKR